MTIKEQYRSDIQGNWDFRLGTLSDQSGNGNDGTSSGNPRWVSTPIGRALFFDAVDDNVDVGSDTIADKAVTIIAAVNLDNWGKGGDSGRIIDNGKFVFEMGSTAFPRIRLTSDGFGVVVSSATGGLELNKDCLISVTRAADGVANFYINGVLNGTANQGSGTPEAGTTNSILGNNNAGNGTFGGRINFIIQFDRVLTALEMAELYEEGIKEAHLDFIPSNTILPEGEADKSSIAGWDMNIRGGSILDISGNGRNATMVGSLTQVDGINGKALNMEGTNSYLTVADHASLQTPFSGGGTIEAWFLARSDGESSLGRILQKLGLYLYCSDEAAGFMKMTFRKGFTTTDGIWVTTDAIIPLNTPVQLLISYDSGTVDENPTFYVNGTAFTVGSGLTESQTPVGTSESETGTLYIGNYGSLDGNWDGWIDTLKFHNIAMNDAQATAQYEKAKSKLTYYADGKDWNVSTANESSGLLSNTDWELNSVNTQVVDNGDGDGSKYILANASGTQGSRRSEQAFGTWEMDIYNTSGVFQTVQFMAQDKFAAFNNNNNYNISFRDDGSVLLRRGTVGTTTTLIDTSPTTFSFDAWHTFKVTRNGGSFELFVDGASQGTATDTTHVSSSYMTLDLDTTGRVRNFRFSPVVQ